MAPQVATVHCMYPSLPYAMQSNNPLPKKCATIPSMSVWFALNIVDTTVLTYITNGANVLPFMAFIYCSVGLK